MTRRATRDDHETFCTTEGWDLVRNARGKPVRHHRTYRLVLTSREVLRTRISRPVDRTTYGPAMWAHILTDQIHVTEAEFWACVVDGQPPLRGPAAPPSATAIPASLVHQLIVTAGLSESEVARLTRQQAIDVMRGFWGGQDQ